MEPRLRRKRLPKFRDKLLKLLLKQIREAIAYREQWSSYDQIKFQYEAHIELQTLVELLEVYHCGQVGGFAPGQPDDQNLLERAKWILAKFGAPLEDWEK